MSNITKHVNSCTQYLAGAHGSWLVMTTGKVRTWLPFLALWASAKSRCKRKSPQKMYSFISYEVL